MHNVKRLIQVTEEAQNPIFVPLIICNECFIAKQQDIRKIEDTRLLTYSKLTPKGDLIPMEALGHDTQTRDAILNACQIRMQLEQNALSPTNIDCLPDLIARLCGKQQPMDESAPSPFMMPPLQPGQQQEHPFLPTNAVATVEQQLQWEKTCPNTSAPFPLHYTTATSTAELTAKDCGGRCCCCGFKSAAETTQKKKSLCSRGANTVNFCDSSTQKSDSNLSAREQLKNKKMSQELSYIS